MLQAHLLVYVILDAILCCLCFRQKGRSIKVKYAFVTGETVEIEVDDEIGVILKEMDKEEESATRYQRMKEVCFFSQMDHTHWGACELYDESLERSIAQSKS